MSVSPQHASATARFEVNVRLRALLLEGLDLPDTPERVDFDQPLFGRGLELDSLDTLEIVSLVEEEYGVLLSDADRTVFGSLNKLADAVTDDSR